MSDADAEPTEPGHVTMRPEAETMPRDDANDLLARAMRIRERSKELIAELGADHPLVAQALQRADALEREAAHPGEIHLR
jgi:hypothetical protein